MIIAPTSGTGIQGSEFEHELSTQADCNHNTHDSSDLADSTATVEVKEVAFNSSEYFASVLNKEQQFRNNEKTQQEINSLMQELKTNVEGCLGQEQLSVVKKHLQSAVSSMEVYNHYQIAQGNAMFNQTSNPPPNTCDKKTATFFFYIT